MAYRDPERHRSHSRCVECGFMPVGGNIECENCGRQSQVFGGDYGQADPIAAALAARDQQWEQAIDEEAKARGIWRREDETSIATACRERVQKGGE